MHNQWLYGMNAISSLYRFLKFVDVNKGNQFNPFEKPSLDEGLGILDAVYSIDIETGYHTGNHRFPTNKKDENYEECCEDPTKGDNNNGITIIDLADPKNPAYCFLSIHHLECLDDSKESDPEGDEPVFVNFSPISVDHWIALHYGDNWATRKDTPIIPERIDFIKQHAKLLTTKRLIEIFPKLKAAFKEGEKDREKLEPNSIKLIKSMNTVADAVKKAKKTKPAHARS